MTSSSSFLCLDLHQCAYLVWTVARARALQQQTQLEWQPYRDSKVLNAIYGVLFWKEGPGTVEIRQDQRKVAALTDQFFVHMFDEFLLRSFVAGPAGLVQYVDELVRIRTYALQSVSELLQSASSINIEVADEAHETVKTLAAVKLGSALALAGISCGIVLTGGTVVMVAQVSLVKLVNDYASLVTGLVVTPGTQISGNVGAVGYQLKKTAVDMGVNKRIDHNREMGERVLKGYEHQLELAAQRVERYSADLATKIRGSKRVVAGRRLDKALLDVGKLVPAVESAEAVVKTAQHAGMAASVVFTAWDVMDALNTYYSDVAAAR